jgi:methionine-R-sulfoxide reductase
MGSLATCVAIATFTTLAGAQARPVTNARRPAVSTTARFVKPTDAELRARLTAEQYQVTQEDGTERAFRNAYWDNHAPGIYVDIVSGEALFSSLDKFESGTGWPSFTKALESANVRTKSDRKFFMTRTEVRSAAGDSHLGHLFDDGPKPTGQRYCMNSASLRFIPVDRLVAEGYGQYAALFSGRGSHE